MTALYGQRTQSATESLPVLWRHPQPDIKRGAKLKGIIAVSFHTLDAYKFNALEMVQMPHRATRRMKDRDVTGSHLIR